MTFKILLVAASVMLYGCVSSSFSPDDSAENLLPSTTSSANKSDDSYLQIAKDLFVAGQYRQAYQISSNLAEKNNVEAQYLLGYMIFYGYGVPADEKQGTKWINVSADTGYRPAIEALVLIKHGLTPDNKCSSVNLLPESKNVSHSETSQEPRNRAVTQHDQNAEPMITDASASQKVKNTMALTSTQLKEGEVLITPKKK